MFQCSFELGKNTLAKVFIENLESDAKTSDLDTFES